MNTPEHTVEPTSDGRFALMRGAEVIGMGHSEAALLTAAAALNSGPVRSVSAGGRWDVNTALEDVAA